MREEELMFHIHASMEEVESTCQKVELSEKIKVSDWLILQSGGPGRISIICLVLYNHHTSISGSKQPVQGKNTSQTFH